ncbi:MAG TPA: ribonuclease R [Pseudothermotoga sp.]|nr:ribonuclease R [Pseudothermotoga sp.]HOK83656.1 ribonuclease R [Pseudothermotoga sp.]HPP69295.1 ribonuclease R [Pseudothermotoga sp.]
MEQIFAEDVKLTQKEILKLLGVKNKNQRKQVKTVLNEFIKEGIIVRDGRGRYRKIGEDLIVGTIEFTRRGNMAFVMTENSKEVAVPLDSTNGAIHGDKVLVEIMGRWRNLPMGRVVKVLERGREKIVGVLQLKRSLSYVVPDDSKIVYDFYVPVESIHGARPGQKVIAKITKWPTHGRYPEAEIVSVLGDIDDPAIDIPSVVAKHGLRDEFPSQVIEEIQGLPDRVLDEEKKDRKNFTDQIVFTIDGEDAKDFDDAVSIKKLSKSKYLLSIHIADVSHYVKEGSAVDREAFSRGTSVYLLDKVIPMLPFKLSNNLCSLVEGEDRLTFTVQMTIDREGNTIDYEIAPSVIKSKKRLTYTLVNEYFAGDKLAQAKLGKKICHSLDLMRDLSKILRENRRRRGAILDVEGGEVDVITDSKGHVVDIVPRKRGEAEILIEEFMIKANETVAEIFHNAGLPFVYRIHEQPDPEVLLQLREYVEALGLKIKFPKTVHPSILQKVLEAVKDHPLRSSVEKLLVRSMKRAIYSAYNVGHFGLASFAYTHFTSPIRRYPDLMVHRLLKLYVKQGGKFKSEQIEMYSQLLPKIAEHCSKRERVADEAEWDLISIKKVEYISRYMGKVFDVVVTNVARFGLFVEIPDKLISGLIHISTLSDYYNYDEKKNILIGERSGRTFKIGDVIKARVTNANKISGEVDFELVEDENNVVDKRVSR